MIGTTFKLGFDGSQVQRGLGRLTHGLGRGLGRVGIGALERVGHRVTDLMGRLVYAIPDTLKQTADWAGSMTDMATATGMSVEQLVLLEEKFRLAGVKARESGQVMSRFAGNLKEAGTTGGAAAEALRALGFRANEFMDMPIDESFEKIGKALNAGVTGGWLKNPEGIMSDLFGERLGYQNLKLFRDWANVSAQAVNNVGKLASAMGSGQAANLDKWADSLGRFENFKRSLASIALDELFKISPGGAGMGDSFFNAFDPEKLRPKISKGMATLREELGKLVHDPGGYIKGGIRGIGKELALGAIDALKPPGGGFLKTSAMGLMGAGLPGMTLAPMFKTLMDYNKRTSDETSRQTPILRQIAAGARATFN